MDNIGKVQCKFLSHILILFIAMRGRINFLQLGRFGEMDEHSYRYQFGKDFNWIEFNSLYVSDLCSDEKIIGFDPSYIRKSGKHTHGVGYFYSGCHSRYERGLEIGCFAAIDIEQNTAYHLVATQTEYSKKKDQDNLLHQYCEMLKTNAKELIQISTVIVVDAWFYKEKYITTCTANGFECITRMRDDADLKYIFIDEQSGGKGRHKKYAGKVNLKNIDKAIFKQVETNDELRIYESTVYCVMLKSQVKVAFVEFLDKLGNVQTSKIFMSTNLNRDAKTLIKYYRARYQMEFNFRDAKQYAGLTHCQSRDKDKLDYHFNASLTSVNIAKAISRQGTAKSQPKALCIEDVKTELSNKLLLDLFLSNSEITPHLIKNRELIAKILSFGKKVA
ncbi:MAG: transposase [Saprospiraceae bacterium]